MNDNTTSSVFGIDLGGLFDSIGTKYANVKGYDSIFDLATNEAAKNIARLTDKAGEDVKQTPASIQPGAWAQQIQAALPVKLNLSNAQLMLAGLAGVGILFLLIKRR